MATFNFDMEMFETHFKPWLVGKLQKHADTVVQELTAEYSLRMREIAFREVADLAVIVADMNPDTFARNIFVRLTISDTMREEP